MKYTEIKKKHVYDLLYPFIANAVGISDFNMRNDPDFKVEYHSNKLCFDGDNADNAMHKLTLECSSRKIGKVYFIPKTNGGYGLYSETDMLTELSANEWEIIRPKVFDDFTEYFREVGIALETYQMMYDMADFNQFIRTHYSFIFAAFRTTLQESLNVVSTKSMNEPVDILFSSSRNNN